MTSYGWIIPVVGKHNTPPYDYGYAYNLDIAYDYNLSEYHAQHDRYLDDPDDDVLLWPWLRTDSTSWVRRLLDWLGHP